MFILFSGGKINHISKLYVVDVCSGLNSQFQSSACATNNDNYTTPVLISSPTQQPSYLGYLWVPQYQTQSQPVDPSTAALGLRNGAEHSALCCRLGTNLPMTSWPRNKQKKNTARREVVDPMDFLIIRARPLLIKHCVEGSLPYNNANAPPSVTSPSLTTSFLLP